MPTNNPNPGSDEAVKLGCKCAQIDNSYGRGYMGQKDIFVITEICPMHGRIEDAE